MKVADITLLIRKAQNWFGFTYHGALRNLTKHTKWQPCEKGSRENIAPKLYPTNKNKTPGIFFSKNKTAQSECVASSTRKIEEQKPI